MDRSPLPRPEQAQGRPAPAPSSPTSRGAARSADVAILLSSYNGAAYLPAQLDSILGQTCPDWTLIVRDDGSTDATAALVQKYLALDDRIRRHEAAPGNVGPAASFSALLVQARQAGFRYVMFCDQDDVWERDKIALSMERLRQVESRHPGMPVLLHTDLSMIDSAGAPLHSSFWAHAGMNPRLNSTARLLLENTVTGCTSLLNEPLMRLVADIPAGAVMHDWWIALVASLFGRIEVVPTPTVRYRQHGANVFGARDAISRIPYARLFGEPFWRAEAYRRRRNVMIERPRRQARCLVDRYGGPDAPQELSLAEAFCATEKLGWLGRRRLLVRHGILRQRMRSNVSFFMLL